MRTPLCETCGNEIDLYGCGIECSASDVLASDVVDSIIYAAAEDWYVQHQEAPPKDDAADSIINAILDACGMRTIYLDDWRFKGSKQEFVDATVAGLDTWLASFSD